MNKYDDIVVGSGISGLTLTLILAMNGRKVLLLEKNTHIGGSLSRFYRQGIPFDTGFHFTGGLNKGGVLNDMLLILGINEKICPIFLSEKDTNGFYFESENKLYELHYGFEEIINKLKDYFPDEKKAIDKYFEKVKSVCARTTFLNFRSLQYDHFFLDEDFVSLEDVLNNLTKNNILKALLSGLITCYGVTPKEVSFACHSRMCYSIYESMAYIKDGGNALIEAFKTKFKKYDIEIKCNTFINSLEDINNKKVGRFILNDNEEIIADNCIFTIHPKEILKIIPDKFLSRAFKTRVSEYEPSLGFFAVFGIMDTEIDDYVFGRNIVSIFPHDDLNKIVIPEKNTDSAILLIKSIEESAKGNYKTVCMLETDSFKNMELWQNTYSGKRPDQYKEYKKEKTENLINRIAKIYPEYKNRFEILDSASILTFKDYLNNNDGSAYGIKQKIGQMNLLGKLPLHNLYAAGQSSVGPGIIGSMISSFITGRLILEEKQYNTFINENL